MKKVFLIVLCVLLCAGAFTACSSAADDKGAEKSTTVSTEKNAESSEKTSADSDNNSVVKNSDTDFEEAAISDFEAVDKVKNMSMDKLGLSGEKDDYKFMVSTVGKSIEGKDYFEVVASKVTKENEDGSVNMDTIGTYYVSYDAKTVLCRNAETGEFTDISK